MIDKLSSMLTDLRGIVIKPGVTLGKMMEKKQWMAMFLLICVITLIISYYSAPETLKQMSEQLPEDYANGFAKPSVLKKSFLSVFSVFLLFFQLIIGTFFIYLFFGIGGSKGEYANFFSLTVNAAVVGTLIPMTIRGIFLLFDYYIKDDKFLNLTVFFPAIHPESWSYAILSQFEIFYLCFIVLIALGVSSYSKMGKIKTLIISILFFIFRSTVVILFYMLVSKLMHSLNI